MVASNVKRIFGTDIDYQKYDITSSKSDSMKCRTTKVLQVQIKNIRILMRLGHMNGEKKRRQISLHDRKISELNNYQELRDRKSWADTIQNEWYRILEKLL